MSYELYKSLQNLLENVGLQLNFNHRATLLQLL